MTGNTWTYTLYSSYARGETLDISEALSDTYTFSASDGSTQQVIITIKVAAEVDVVAGNTQSSFDDSDLVGIVDFDGSQDNSDLLSSSTTPVADPEQPGMLESQPDQAEETTDTETSLTDTLVDSEQTDDSIIDVISSQDLVYNSAVADAPVPEDIFLSVLSERPTTIKNIDVTKPTVEITQTFLQEITSFWKDDGITATTPSEIGFSETGLAEIDRHSSEFLDDLNKMRRDLDASAEALQIKQELSVGAVSGVSVTAAALFVSWTLRSGSLLASLLTAMPAWRSLDVLPILASDEKSRATQSADDGDQHKEASDKEAEGKIDELFEE